MRFDNGNKSQNTTFFYDTVFDIFPFFTFEEKGKRKMSIK